MPIQVFATFAELARILSRPVLVGALALTMLTASRLLLIAIFWDRVAGTDGVGFIVLQGVRFDLILAGMLLGPVLLFKPFFHANRALAALGRWLWAVYLALVMATGFFVEASTFSFIREYDSRPNYIFVEYLTYPKELFSTLTGSHLVELILFSAATAGIFWGVAKWMYTDPAATRRLSWWRSLLALPLLLVLVVMMIRSTLGHRPVNPSVAAFSEDSMVNQLALNSPYSLLYAIYEQRRDAGDKNVGYQPMAEDRALTLILADSQLPAENGAEQAGPTMHWQNATVKSDRPQNLIIVLEESLGAEFVGSLGGRNLTPNLDAAAARGIWMEQLYATGTRSVRGIEAVISGITPTPRSSVVKLRETQENFFTLASLLKRQGYRTSFIYGGEAHFDNMKRFFLNNGFQTVMDENDYVDPVLMGAWGVSDEDLFGNAEKWFAQQGDHPFFSLVFTSSNHDPFDIPPGRVSAESGPDGPRETAVKYADYALGQFLQRVRQSRYWANTVVLVIADHNSRVYGDQLVPIERFHIPGLIVGGSIKPRRITGITSQIDMPPTLLSLIGVSAEHPAIGHDLTAENFSRGANRAMMQFNRIFAYMVTGRVVVLQPDLPASFFLYQPGGTLRTDPSPNADLLATALAYSWFGNLVIRHHWYYNTPPKTEVADRYGAPQ